ncbi:MAG: efflux RND transporter periplasmic adaptor subunit [Planctomycetes bacterium]|nr:efflux RND transporter periplasmic adaptor subunit [Planctomycetota bacterium]
MMRFGALVSVLVVLFGIGCITGIFAERWGWLAAGRAVPTAPTEIDPPAKSGPGIVVRVEPIVAGRLDTPLEMLGSVDRIPGSIHARALSGEVQIVEVLATPGERVTPDTPIVRVESTHSVLASIEQARAAVDSGQALLEESRARVRARVGTRSEVVQAEQVLRSAELRLEELGRTLPPEGGVLVAGSSGTLLDVAGFAGSVVPPSASVFRIADADAACVRFGLPTRALTTVTPGLPVRVVPLLSERGERIELAVERIEAVMDPASRTLPAWTTRISTDGWPIGTPVRVTATSRSAEGLVLPRTALVLSDDGPAVYSVREGTAYRHPVVLLASGVESMCVGSDELTPGDSIVTRGAHELEDGMAVSVEAPR